MRKSINLFQYHKSDTELKIAQAKKLRKSILMVSAFLLVVIVILGVGVFFMQVQVNSAEQALSELNSKLSQSATRQGKITELLYRVELLRSYLRDDAQYLPRYSRLQQLITNSGTDAKIVTFAVGSGEQINFNLECDSEACLKETLEYIESSPFVQSFQVLALDSFTLNLRSAGSETYQMAIRGVFR